MLLSLVGASLPIAGASRVAASDPYSAAVLADNPISYWRLNDTSGTTAVDQTGNDNGGVVGGVTLGQPGPVPGDGAMTFDGSTGYVDLGTNSNLYPQQWTVEAWFKASSESQACCEGAGRIYRNRHYGQWLDANASGYVQGDGCTNAANCQPVHSPGTGYLDGGWHYTAVTHDSAGFELYVDGAQVATMAAPAGTFYSQSDGIALARDGSCGCSYFAGSLAEVAVYGSSVSASRVAAHYAAATCTAPFPSVYTATLAVATQGQTGYSKPLTACDGTGSVTWSLQSGSSLPSGLTLSPAGVISGNVATSATSSTFTVVATDSSNSATGTRQLTLTVNQAPSITTASLQPAAHGETGYSQTLAASGGTGSLMWGLQSGSSLPSGLSLSSAGVISGNVAANASSSTFTVIVTDANGVSAGRQLTLTVGSAPPADRVGPDMYGGLVASGGSAAALPCTGGEPVNCDTGNLIEAATDLTVAGRGQSLQLTRTYNALDAATASTPHRFGYGWSDSESLSLTLDGSTVPAQAIVHTEDGSSIRFVASNGGYAPVGPWVIARLTQNPDGTYTYALPDQTADVFSSAGVLTAERDRDGNTTSFTYDGAGHLATIADPAGRTLTFTVGSNGLVSAATDPMGHVVQYGYDGSGNLTSVTDASGSVTRYGYDGAHRLVSMTRPDGGVTTNIFDTANRVTSQSDPLYRTMTFSYAAGTTTITDPMGKVTVETYQSDNLMSLTKGSGTAQAATSTFTYDAAGHRTSVRDANGNTSTVTYDAAGNLLSATNGLGAPHTTTFTYSALNDLTAVTDPMGYTTTIARDPVGHPLSVSRVHTEDGKPVTTSYTYGDPTHPGDITAETDPDGSTWTFAYDSAGDLVRSTDPLGGATTDAYNAIGWQVSQTRPLGNVTGGNSAQHTSTTTYDGVGDVLTSTDPAGDQTVNLYDADHNRVKQTDANKHVTLSTYDLADEGVEVDRPDGSVLKTSYNANGETATQTDGLGHVTSYTYDPLKRLATETDALKRSTAYGYDGAGNQTTITDPLGRLTTMVYDAANELTNVNYSDGKTPNVSYTYNFDGQRTKMTDGRGTSQYGYDSLGRLTQTIDGSGAEVVGYTYDARGSIVGLTYPGPLLNGSTGTSQTTGIATGITRGYDAAGRMTSVTDWVGHTTNFAYDADGNLNGETLPNGVSTAMSHDNADRLTQSTGTGAAGTILNLPYTRDADGQLTSANASVTSPAVTQTYGYDPANRLTGVTFPAGQSSVPASAYTYDAADHLTSITTGGLLTAALGYDVADELTSATNASGGKTAYTYDPNGNRVTRTDPQGNLTTYGYDQANRLVSYAGPAMNQANAGAPTGSSTVQLQYSYDGNGLRWGLGTAGAVATIYSWDQAEGTPLLLRDALTSYVTDPSGLPLEQVQQNGTVLYYLHDQLGSTRELTDSHGLVVATYLYDAYGNSVGTLPAVVNPFQYAGQYKDVVTGLYYLQARYYDPATGQFLSRDPMVATTRSPYGYVADNPLNGTDPSGLDFGLPLGLCVHAPFGSTDCSGHLSQDVVQSGAFHFLNGWADSMSAGGAGLAESLFGAAPNTCDGNYRGGQIAGVVTGIFLGGVKAAEEVATTPAGRVFSAHYLQDTGPVRNIPGSVVDNVIDHGSVVEDLSDRMVYYDGINDVTVVQSKTTGKIMSVRRGAP